MFLFSRRFSRPSKKMSSVGTLNTMCAAAASGDSAQSISARWMAGKLVEKSCTSFGFRLAQTAQSGPENHTASAGLSLI